VLRMRPYRWQWFPHVACVVLCLAGLIISGERSVMATESTSHQAARPEVHAHRGGAALAPENTLAAFRMALAMDVDTIEMDLHVTRDGKLVVIHDDTLDRTTDGRGSVEHLTLEEVKRWDAGVKFSSAFRGECVPTLGEVIDLVKGSGNTRMRLSLEFKFHPDRPGKPEGFEEQVVELLRHAGFVERVRVISFYHPSVAKIKRLEPAIKTGVLVGGKQPPKDPVGLVRQHQADYYLPGFGLLTPDTAGTLHAAGIPLIVWTVNEETDMRRVIRLGIGTYPGDAIATDYPDRLLRIVGEGQGHRP